MSRCPEKTIKPVSIGVAVTLSSLALSNAEAQAPPVASQPGPSPALQEKEIIKFPNNNSVVKGGRIATATVIKLKISPLARRIGGCETGRPQSPRSKIDFKAQNPHSTASGFAQFLDSTWGGYMGYSKAKYAPARVQVRYFKKLLREDGTRHWDESRWCWD